MKLPTKLLITGAGGFTGQHACDYFVGKGIEVIGVVRNKAFATKQFKHEICDLTNKEAVKVLIEKVRPDYVLHLAGQNHVGKSWQDPSETMEANAMSTLYLLEALQQICPVQQIVVVGSALQFNLNDFSQLPHPYSLSKTIQVMIAKAWAKLYEMPIVIVKPSNLIGPGFSNGVCAIFANKIVEMEKDRADTLLEVNNLYAEQDFLDVRDAIRAYELIMEKGNPGDIYEIASGKSRSLEELIQQYQLLTKTNIKFQVKTKAIQKKVNPIEINTSKINELGWEPTFSFSASLEDILNFYRNYYRNDE